MRVAAQDSTQLSTAALPLTVQEEAGCEVCYLAAVEVQHNQPAAADDFVSACVFWHLLHVGLLVVVLVAQPLCDAW